MSHEPTDAVQGADHSLGHALGAVAVVAVDQARDLAVAQLDRWAVLLHERLAVPADASAPPAASEATAPEVSRLVKPLVVGALAGAVVAWLLANRRTET
ncbi:MAG TPA: hypothetical protein VHX44_07965 [Planctomycetota bacterium]|jgi:hypothetical protein|nr:hypothetical protein [Planctomycetota bacterium]